MIFLLSLSLKSFVIMDEAPFNQGVVDHPRIFVGIHVRVCFLILHTMLLIWTKYGALDIDPLYVLVLMGMVVYPVQAPLPSM